jgi:hypothetical protein
MRYFGGSAFLILGAAVFPLPSRLASSVSAWLVAAVSVVCFIVAYKLLAPSGAPGLRPSAEKDEAD